MKINKFTTTGTNYLLTVSETDFNVLAHLVSIVRSDNVDEPLVRRAKEMAKAMHQYTNADPRQPEVIDGAEYNRLDDIIVNRVNS